jgi:hypothetical protein
MILMKSAKIWIDGYEAKEPLNGAGGFYAPYQIYTMKIPPDLQLKYGNGK